MRGALVLSTAVLFVWGAGCKGTSPVDPWCSDQPHSVETDVEAPTWHEHIEPLVRAKCQSCHTPGGLAPLDREAANLFTDVKRAGSAMPTFQRRAVLVDSPTIALQQKRTSMESDDVAREIITSDEAEAMTFLGSTLSP